MAGTKNRRKTLPLPTIGRNALPGPIDPEFVVCSQCGRGDREELLLICENCDTSMHTYCLNPPLSSVPKGDWRCPTCVFDAVKDVSFEFGFQDSQTLYNLDTFGEWASKFKQDYFKQNPRVSAINFHH